MFESGEVYTNRYRDQYKFVKIDENRYRFEMTGDSMNYGRFGGREGQEGLDPQDLGMFDPSGGPYISIGTGIDGKKIVKISADEDTYIVEVEND